MRGQEMSRDVDEEVARLLREEGRAERLGRHRRMTVDEKSVDLAKHFLTDVHGATAEDETELAESIQQVCEDFCQEVERSGQERAGASDLPQPPSASPY